VIAIAWRAEKPCSVPGCPNTTPGKYCALHQAQKTKAYNQRRRDVRKLYDRNWEKVRDSYIARHPLCELCEAAGRLVPAEHVHHVVPLFQGGTHRDSNLQALCKPCHGKQHPYGQHPKSPI